jgi:hypothetical protein
MTDESAADQPVNLPVGNEVSGHIAGSSVQAGAIHGGVHFHHAPSPAAPVPRQLLTPSPHFINRESELAALDTLLNTTRPVFAILTGPGGVGKTALALRWADQIRIRYPDGQLYVDLAGFSDQDPLDPGEVLGSFLRALGVPPQRVPLDLMEQSALYRSVTAGRSLLVLLDNAFSAAQVRTLLPPLSTSEGLIACSDQIERRSQTGNPALVLWLTLSGLQRGFGSGFPRESLLDEAHQGRESFSTLPDSRCGYRSRYCGGDRGHEFVHSRLFTLGVLKISYSHHPVPLSHF